MRFPWARHLTTRLPPGHTYRVLLTAPAPGVNSLVCGDRLSAEDKFHFSLHSVCAYAQAYLIC